MPVSYGSTNRPHVSRRDGGFEIAFPDEKWLTVPLSSDDLVNLVVGGELALRDLSEFNHEEGPRINRQVTSALQTALARRKRLG